MKMLEKPTYQIGTRWAILLLMALVGLTGCASSNVGDLEAYVNSIKARKGGRIAPLPEIKTYESYLYSASDLRDPFASDLGQARAAATEEIAESPENSLHPDMSRNREELESYPLDSLRMVGTLEKAGQIWAIIQTSDGTVHRVQEGNYVGQNHGHILAVDEYSISLKEIVPDGLGGWQEREASLVLSE